MHFIFLALSLTTLFMPYLSLGSYYSQSMQDKWVNEAFFHNKRNGVFVDIGANDGVWYSNTCFFERELGWKGICIEPLAHIFEELQRNRSAVCINGCISENVGKKKFLAIKNNPQKKDGPFWLSGLLDKYDPRHLNRVEKEVRENGATTQVVEVDCYLLNDLLERNGFYHIDYLSLDTEGGELEILKSIDYERFKIFVIDVENNFNSPEFKNFLASKGFTLATKIGADEIYVNRRNKD